MVRFKKPKRRTCPELESGGAKMQSIDNEQNITHEKFIYVIDVQIFIIPMVRDNGLLSFKIIVFFYK